MGSIIQLELRGVTPCDIKCSQASFIDWTASSHFVNHERPACFGLLAGIGIYIAEKTFLLVSPILAASKDAAKGKVSPEYRGRYIGIRGAVRKFMRVIWRSWTQFHVCKVIVFPKEFEPAVNKVHLVGGPLRFFKAGLVI